MIPIAFDLRDPDRSGIARVARSMARAFTEQAGVRFEVTLCGPTRTLERLDVHAWGPARVVDWDAERFSAKAEATWGRVSRAAGDSIWYFPHWDVPWHAAPKRFIATVHDLISLRMPGATTPFRRELARRWIGHTCRRATRIVTGSAHARSEIISEWPSTRDRIQVIPHGVEPRFFGPPLPVDERIQLLVDAGPYILSVGNRKPHKNLAMGVEVLARIPEIRWIIAGEQFRGWDEVASRIEAAGVSSRVSVLEGESDTVLHALYANAVCLFLPSRYEGFGLPLLEAFACGTPVVAGAAGASVEVLNGHGIVCPPDDVDCFEAGVRQAMDQRANGKAAAASAALSHATSFTWQRAAASLAELIEEIAGQ
jgi:glycosyltransferase involved in cell wall biosynthesis